MIEELTDLWRVEGEYFTLCIDRTDEFLPYDQEMVKKLDKLGLTDINWPPKIYF